jgi:hypothetical protein
MAAINLPDIPKNPLRALPPEGQMMAVMKSNGPLDRIIASVDGYHFKYEEFGSDPNNLTGWTGAEEWEKWELIEDTPGFKRASRPLHQELLEDEFGVTIVGFSRTLFIPHVRYTKREMNVEDKNPKLERVAKDRNDSPYFFFQYNLSVPVLEVEAAGTFQLTVEINVVVRMVNPYKAQFLAGGWESLTATAIWGAVREYVSDKEAAVIQKEKEDDGLTHRVEQLNDGDKGLIKNFGIKIVDVRYPVFDISTKSEAVKRALEAEKVNKLNYDASEFEAKRIERLGTAEANVAGMLATHYGSEGAASVRSTEILSGAIREAKPQFISIGGSGNVPIALTPQASKGSGGENQSQAGGTPSRHQGGGKRQKKRRKPNP